MDFSVTSYIEKDLIESDFIASENLESDTIKDESFLNKCRFNLTFFPHCVEGGMYMGNDKVTKACRQVLKETTLCATAMSSGKIEVHEDFEKCWKDKNIENETSVRKFQSNLDTCMKLLKPKKPEKKKK